MRSTPFILRELCDLRAKNKARKGAEPQLN